MVVGGKFARNVHIRLRCVIASRLAQSAMGRQPTTGILLPVQREVNIRRHSHQRSILFCRPQAFGLLICKFRRQQLRFRQTAEVVVFRPEVVLRDRKWLPPS